MPADGGHRAAIAEQPTGDQSSARHDRPALTAFIADARSEEALRDGLIDFSPGEIDIRRGGIRGAIASMQKQATPRVLIAGGGIAGTVCALSLSKLGLKSVKLFEQAVCEQTAIG